MYSKKGRFLYSIHYSYLRNKKYRLYYHTWRMLEKKGIWVSKSYPSEFGF